MLLSRYLSPLWSRFFAQPAPRMRRSSQPPPWPKTLSIRTRRELEVAWLLHGLPFTLQKALWPEIMALLLRHPPVDSLPTEEYIRPDFPGIIRPRYSSGALAMKTLEGLERRLEEELTLSIPVLCAPEGLLPRPMRSALLAMEGARLGQIHAALGRYLSAEKVRALFRQKLAAWT